MTIDPPPTNDNEPEPSPPLRVPPIPVSGYLWMGVIGILPILFVVLIPLKLALGSR
jgi:hypothetical protein